MSEEKNPVGRPRKYDSRADRQKAYYERKKKKMKTLEKQVEQLEQQKQVSLDIDTEVIENIIFKDVKKISWKKITPSEIALMGTQDLREFIEDFQEKIGKMESFEISLENIIMGVLSKNHYETLENSNMSTIQEIKVKIKENITTLEDRIQQQTLLYLMEAELANRERLEGKKAKLDIFEAKIDELEKEVTEKIEIKKKAQ
ncbi:MAG: hypothetical protein FK734_14095 [Asgard group archaeon]|nr:hypothetical protein [Asgard group archaeon]